MDRILDKLTSRKFWMALTSFVSMLMIAMGKTESEAAQVSALIMAGASVIAYVIGEGLADAAYAGTQEAPTIVLAKPEEEEADGE